MADISRQGAYLLNRDYAATTRLNCQFFLWKTELGFNLHPSIPMPPPGARIADVATGTGVWLLDLARQLPGRQLEGFDISLAQCPPIAWLPGDISLQAWDMFTEPPKELIGKFDIVHLRLLLLVVRDNDPAPIIANAAKMLKPGGYIQWDELNVFGAFVATTDVAGVAAGFQSAQELADFTTLEWVKHLPATMSKQGFCDAVVQHYDCDLSLAKYFQDMQLLVMEEEVERRLADVREKERVHQQINAIHEESKRGIARCTPKMVCVARKPL